MASKPETISRTVLPIPDRPFTGAIMFDAKDPNSKFPPIKPLRPPKGAPNAVSYTHLDVYKRQVMGSPVER